MIPKSSEIKVELSSQYIWVERDRYHTAIVLPTQLVRELAQNLLPVLTDRPLVRFGWGDRGYYGADRQSFYLAFKALVLPTRSVMEVSSFDSLEDVGEQVVQLSLQQIDVNKLLVHIKESFSWSSGGLPMLERVGSNGFHYYSASGIYHMFKNCNNWTAKALKISGLNIFYLRAFFAGSVMKQL